MLSPVRVPVHARRGARGFSLIEVLVALLVLAVGLLGLAALQTQGVRFNHDAMVRTSATNLAADIMDTIRTARAQDGAGAEQFVTTRFPARNPMPTDGFTTVDPPYNCDLLNAAIPVLNPPTVTAAVVSAAIANAALPCWLNDVELTLPLGRADIAQQGATNLYDITLMWLDREPRQFGAVTRPPQTAVECEALPNRFWPEDGTDRCFVTQTWTLLP